MLRIRSIVSLLKHKSFISRNASTSSDEPVKYSMSKASAWKAEYSRRGLGKRDESAWFQPYVVCGSLAVFLYYFTVFREENDVDEALGITLYDRIDGLEEAHLKMSLAHNLEKGKDVTAIKARLKEIQDSQTN